jgi:hypothetical protein
VGRLIRKKKIPDPQRTLSFDKLFKYLKASIGQFPDIIERPNRSYSIEDIGLSAFSVFFMQSPSFLSHQNLMKQARGKSNAETIIGMNKIPSDTHIKFVLDSVSPEYLFPVFDKVSNDLYEAGNLDEFSFLDDQLLIAFDGTDFFSSNNINCKNCSTTNHKNGETSYHHKAITPVIVKPGHNKVISLPPEFIIPQDGKTKQDCEINAMERWLKKHAEKYLDKKITALGDDLYAKQPNIQRVLDKGFNYIFTCKEDSHKYLYECLSLLESSNGTRKNSEVKFHGRDRRIYTYRFVNGLPLRKKNFLCTNWCELTITNEEGKKTFKTACVSNFEITESNVRDIIRAHRSRWKVENENNNVLKTKGYCLEHNFGHGKEYLTSVLVTMNLLAFLFHTVLHIVDKAYTILRKSLGKRTTFFECFRSLTRFQLFENWRNLLKFMLDGLEIEFDPD